MKERKSIIDRAWDVQRRIENKFHSIGKGKYGRVIKMARKPTSEEYNRTLKITMGGMFIIGGIGFVIYIVKQVVAPWVMTLLGI